MAVSSLLQGLPAISRDQSFTKCSACLFSTSAYLEAKKGGKHKVRRRIDPYRLAQARQRKAANQARQQVLQAERAAALGDPVRSRPTPFVDSLSPNSASEAAKSGYMNYYVKAEDLNKSIEYSRWLTQPPPPENEDTIDPKQIEEEKRRFDAAHENASRALAAITALENGSTKDRTRVNVQRCIEEFGRHNTDKTFASKPASILSSPPEKGNMATDEIPKRVGPDTGSSEVQAAILTAKINVMVNNLHKKDKHNKRNLRLLVHKRQKHLSYLRARERGGPRWQHLVEKLGINDAMWKGEISL